MKNCPFCAEKIQDEAILCKHCGSRLDVDAATIVGELPGEPRLTDVQQLVRELGLSGAAARLGTSAAKLTSLRSHYNIPLPGEPQKSKTTPSPSRTTPFSVTVTDIRMPFWSMVEFMVLWALASIPAIIILFVLGWFIVVLFFSGIVGLFSK